MTEDPNGDETPLVTRTAKLPLVLVFLAICGLLVLATFRKSIGDGTRRPQAPTPSGSVVGPEQPSSVSSPTAKRTEANQGNWQNWFNLTQKPENNPYGQALIEEAARMQRETQGGQSLVLALPPAKEQPAEVKRNAGPQAIADVQLSSEIGRGLEHLFYVELIPIGEIGIYPASIAALSDEDRARKKFLNGYADRLNALRDGGLITFRRTPSEFNKNMAWGCPFCEFYEVTPSENARKFADAAMSSANYLAMRVGSAEVMEIMQKSAYRHARLPASADYNLVFGTYRYTPSELSTQLSRDAASHVFKFRAIVEFNPFTKQYVFRSADWGFVNANDWQTDNVERGAIVR